jgi:hypothetical protein
MIDRSVCLREQREKEGEDTKEGRASVRERESV